MKRREWYEIRVKPEKGQWIPYPTIYGLLDLKCRTWVKLNKGEVLVHCQEVPRRTK